MKREARGAMYEGFASSAAHKLRRSLGRMSACSAAIAAYLQVGLPGCRREGVKDEFRFQEGQGMGHGFAEGGVI